MKRKILALTLVVLLTLISGCTGIKKPTEKNPVTLNMWHNYGGEMQKTMDSLIDEFNTTVGKEKGILINVTAISSSSELNESLKMIANDDPGAPIIPDICTAYPKIAISLKEKNMLLNFDDYLSKKDIEKHVPEFINEGRIDNGLYVFPLAKSTEILYLNKTLFDEFSAATGADVNKLNTFEGICELADSYHAWSGGNAFFAADSWFNVAQVGAKQLGEDILKNEQLNINTTAYNHIFNTFYNSLKSGAIANYDGYSSDLSKTGDIVCSIGSSAGILFYGDTITYPDNTVKHAEYNILPYPTFEAGQKIALQRGGGLIVSKSDKKREYASCEFIKWLTAPEQNMRFVSSTGYLPVTKTAFEKDIKNSIDTIEDTKVKKMLSSVMQMYENYDFFAAPAFSNFDKISKNYEKSFKEIMKSKDYINSEEALKAMKK